uniref:Acetyltransf_18 domain-containing protein n=1 Tax=Panagrellus redivivus TaxID=6233 RepID=A0A7E4VD43_PANRE
MVSSIDDIKIVEHANVSEWKQLVKLVKKHEGWIVANEDYDTWIRSFGAENFNLIIAFDKATGKQLLGAVAIAFANADGPAEDGLVTVGMFFVVPECRKMGLGSKLFEIGLADKRYHGINKGLNGVAAMSEKYADRYGFNKYTQSAFAVVEVLPTDLKLNFPSDSNIQIGVPTVENLDQLIQYDIKQSQSIPRPGYLKEMITSNTSLTRIAHEADEIVGFGRIRAAIAGNLAIGPLYAKSPEVAKQLLARLMKDFANSAQYTTINFYPLFNNVTFWKLLTALTDGKFKVHAPLYTQFTLKAPEINSRTIYSITDHAMSVY